MVLFLDHYRGIHVKHGSHSDCRANGKSLNMYFKGQIISEWIYEIINFPKNDPKNLKDCCPTALRVLIAHRAEILQIFRDIFWKIDDFINPF